MAIDLSKSSKTVVSLVVFTWGNPTKTKRYVRADHDMNINGLDYIALPGMTWKMSKRHGGVADQTLKLTIPRGTEPFETALFQTHPPITCHIGETSTDDLLVQFDTVHRGRALELEAHVADKASIIDIKVGSLKHLIKNARLGVVTMDFCDLRFGDHICQRTVPTVNALCTNIFRNNITFANIVVTDTPSKPRYFERGFVSFDSLDILVTDHDGTVGLDVVIGLARPAPKNWLGETIVLSAGCNKTKGDCTAWVVTDRFRGLGLKQPSYDPRFQDSP